MESANDQSLLGNYVLDRRIRTMLSTAKITLCELNLTDKVLNWSVDKSFHFYDFSQSYDGTLDGYFQLIHDEDKEQVNNLFQNLEFDKNIAAEHRVLWPDGTYHWLEAIGRASVENGISRLVGTFQDVTERKELEHEKNDWEIRHKLVAQAAGIIVYDYDIESGGILWSGNVKEVTSFTAEEMGDIDRWGELIHPDDREEAFRLLEEAQHSLNTYEVHYRFMKSSGEYCHMYDRGTFVSKSGKAVRMLGMMSDVSELVYSKAALVESEKRFKSLMNNLNVGVGLYGETMIAKIYNKAAYLLLGMTEEQFVGRAVIDPAWNVIDGDGEVMKQEDFPIPQSIDTGLAVRQVVMGVYRPAMNDRVWLMVDADPVYDESLQLLHVVCTYTDFSLRRRMEETLIENNKHLLLSSEELGRKNERLLEFAQIVSHNLRSPLSSIAGLSELYFNSNRAEQDEAVHYIKDVCDKALKTIDDLNETLKVKQSERLERRVLQFDEAFCSVEELMKIKLLERGVIIESNFDEAPEVIYPQTYLESIFLNLLSNSIKYTSSDHIPKIEIKTLVKGNDVVLLFKDHGMGIDLAKYGNDIFNFGKTFHSQEGGRGVGLYLVKNQIRTMGDSIEVESKVGIGTTFKIVFKNQLDEK